VIPALNEAGHLRRTVESALATAPGAEIIVVDDGSRDGCADFLRGGHFPVTLLDSGPDGQRLGAGQARNKGAHLARANRIVFADAHVVFPPRWAEELCDALENPSVGAAAPAISVLGRPESKGYGLRWNNAQLGIEWLQFRTLHYDPMHPPLARMFVAAGPYLDGVRWQGWGNWKLEGVAELHALQRNLGEPGLDLQDSRRV